MGRKFLACVIALSSCTTRAPDCVQYSLSRYDAGTADIPAIATSEQPNSILLGPTVSFYKGNSLQFFWNTKLPSKNSYVEIAADNGPPRYVKGAEETIYPTIMVGDLAPGRIYTYRVGGDGYKSPPFQVKTPPTGGSFRIGIWADNQDGCAVFHQQTVPVLAATKPDILLAVGDLVDNGAKYHQWGSQLYGPAHSLLSKIPWYPVRGNHDGESPLALKMLPFPKNQQWFATTLGPIRLVILDSNLPYDKGSKQYAWLENETSAPEWIDASFRIVAFHHPPYTELWTDKKHSGEDAAQKSLVPLFQKTLVDIVFNGHAHAYQYGKLPHGSGSGFTHYFTVGGAGGSLDEVVVGDWPHIEFTASTYHIVTADVSRESMTIRALAFDRKTPFNNAAPETLHEVVVTSLNSGHPLP